MGGCFRKEESERHVCPQRLRGISPSPIFFSSLYNMNFMALSHQNINYYISVYLTFLKKTADVNYYLLLVAHLFHMKILPVFSAVKYFAVSQNMPK